MKIALASALLMASVGLFGPMSAIAGEGGPDAIGGQGAGSPAAANVSNGATVGGATGSQYTPGYSPAQQRRLAPDNAGRGRTSAARQSQTR